MKLGNHDYTVDRAMDAKVHRNHRDRNPCSSGGAPSDSANDHSCGAFDWGSMGALIGTSCPCDNNPFQGCHPCCNVGGHLPTAVSPICSVEVVAHEVACDRSGAQFGALEPCSYGLACCIHIAPPYGPSNGRYDNVVVNSSREQSGQIWRTSWIAVLSETEFLWSLAMWFGVCPWKTN